LKATLTDPESAWSLKRVLLILRIVSLGITIKKSATAQIGMRLRTLISGLLILLLMPIFSFSASCNVSCGMLPETAKHSSHRSSIEPMNAMHHHHAGPEQKNKNDGSAARANSHNISSNHTCCNGGQPVLLKLCLSLQGGILPETMISTGVGDAAPPVAGDAVLLTINERAVRRAFGDIHFPAPSPRSLPLRI